MQLVVFWNIEWLKRRLKQQPLNGREVYIYFFCWLFLFSMNLLISDEPSEDTFSSLLLYFDAALPLIALIYGWLCNGGRTGKHFIQRLLSLGWVITMRTLIFSLPLFFILAFSNMEPSKLVNETAGTLIGFFMIWRLGHHMQQLRDNSTDL